MSLSRKLRTAFSVAVCASAATGCLSSNYTIKRAELERLARAPEQSRAEDVHVKQRIVFSRDGEPSDPLRMLVEVYEAERLVAVMAREAAEDLAAVKSGVATVRVANASRSQASSPTPKASSSARSASGDAPTDAGERSAENANDTDKKRSKAQNDDTSKAIVVGAIVVFGVIIGTALAVSEGQRFDGFVATAPDAPVHLIGRNGEIGWVPLRSLRPSMLEGVDEGLLSSSESPLVRTRSAPLDRVGFTYAVELGAGGMNALDRSLSPGAFGRIGIGAFPTSRFGVLAGSAFAIGSKGPVSTGSEIRPLLEVNAYPLEFGTHHVGLYANGGYLIGKERLSSLEERNIGSWFYGGGLLYQHELTTLLALTVRGGVAVVPNPAPAVVAPEFTVGVAVY